MNEDPSPRLIIGVDPGLTGGIAAIDQDGAFLDAIPMPVESFGKKKLVDPIPIRDWALGVAETFDKKTREVSGFIQVALEDVAGFTGEFGAFAFGHAAAIPWCLFRNWGLPIEMIRPTQWSAILPMDLGSGYARKKKIVELARKRWPDAPLKTVKNGSGIADALFIAEYHRRISAKEMARAK